jgi:acetoin utilization deacetylase AcuC-like enzyme
VRVVFSERHRLYAPRFDLVNGQVKETASPAKNADIVLAAIERDLKLPIRAPDDFGLDPILRLHDPAYVRFLQTVWDEWVALFGAEGEALPMACVQRGMRQHLPQVIDGKVSYYAQDICTPIGPGTWEAAYASAQVALTAAAEVAGGARSAYGLARPGGHHAGYDYYAGYCFLATESLAIQHLLDNGTKRIAYLDVDYHHCNGTQALFYRRGDVITVSIHCDPDWDYPFFSGFADERGEGPGEGCNLNLPLPWGTTLPAYAEALETGLAAIRGFGADALVVLLGVDTFEQDRISRFKLTHDAYPRIGAAIAGLGLPTVFIKGGGYSEEGLDRCVTALLGGFLGCA